MSKMSYQCPDCFKKFNTKRGCSIHRTMMRKSAEGKLEPVWNKGKTKETHPSIASSSEKMTGRTKYNHPGVAITAKKVSKTLKGRTKYNDPGVAKMAATKSGKTKETCPGHAAQAEKTRGRTKETHPGVASMAKKLRGRPNPKVSRALKGRTKETDPQLWPEERCKKYSQKSTEWHASLTPEEKESHFKKVFVYRRPNKPEAFLFELLEFIAPNFFEYTGDGSGSVGGKFPDFISKNGNKKVVEMNGTYWHSEEVTGQAPKEHEQERIAHYKKYGYDCLVVWEHELKKSSELVIEKIKEFIGGK